MWVGGCLVGGCLYVGVWVCECGYLSMCFGLCPCVCVCLLVCACLIAVPNRQRAVIQNIMAAGFIFLYLFCFQTIRHLSSCYFA